MKTNVLSLSLSVVVLGRSVLARPAPVSKLIPRNQNVYTKCKKSGDFALTFDDGPYKYEKEVVAHLDEAGVLGTFFVNGYNYDCIYNEADNLRAAYDAGHVIASHTWSHADISKLSKDDFTEELYKLEVALKKILGIKPKLFRPPFGNYDEDALDVLADRGYSTVTWSMDSGDSMGESESQSEQEYRRQASQFPTPGIGLNHETYQSTADHVVPFAIRTLQDAGYNLVSVAECLGIEAYEYVGGRTERDDSWHC